MQVQRYNGPVVSEIAVWRLGELSIKLTGASVEGRREVQMLPNWEADEVGFGWRDGIVRACPRIVKGAYSRLWI